MATINTELITDISQLPAETLQLVNARKVTYRGTGFGGDCLLKISGQEYLVDWEIFDQLGGLEKIRFSAPYRSECQGEEVWM